LILAIPLAIIEPFKLVALFVVGEGHFVAGVLIMVFAYAAYALQDAFAGTITEAAS
jgi:hypothetical protein